MGGKHGLQLLSLALALTLALALPAAARPPVSPLADDASSPAAPVKLIFIHHSTGGNWLADTGSHENAGGLGRPLMENNYFVSATNYGWQAAGDAIGDRTDIGNWWEWFAGPGSAATMAALYAESGQNIGDFGPWPRLTDPGGENRIVLFKSCFPNSHLGGNPGDLPTTGDNPLRGLDAWAGDDIHNVANAKGIYNDILATFGTRRDKLFVVITAPPLLSGDTDASHAANARAFNDWLVHDWLDGYPHANVAVFDFFNVLTSNGGSPTANDLGAEGGNHHRWRDGAIQHVHPLDSDYLAYGLAGDSHPTAAGGQKAAGEFVPWLNVIYNRWRASGSIVPTRDTTDGSPTATEATPAPQTPTVTTQPGATATLPAGQGEIVLQQGVSPETSYAGCTDAFISREEADVNVGHLENLETFWADEEARRSLLRFELPSLPAEAHVVDAQLELYRYDGDSVAEMVIGAYGVTAAWVEGTGWNLWPEGAYTADGVTWLSPAPGADWTAPGGDHDTISDYGHGPTGLVGQAVLPTGASNGWVALDVTALARAWLEKGVPNHGLLVRPHGGQVTYQYFASSQHEHAAWRPRLTIRFVVGEEPVVPTRTLSAPTASPTSAPPSVTTAPQGTPSDAPPVLGVLLLPLIFKGDPRPVLTPLAPAASPTPSPPTPAPTATSGGTASARIQPEDLVYQGAFRLPGHDGEYGWAWSGHALAYRPNGDPQGASDGYPGSLFGTGHNHLQHVGEVSIPEPVVSPDKDVSELNMATTLQGFRDVRGDLFDGIEGFDVFAEGIPKAGLAYLNGPEEAPGGRLHFCWGYHLQYVPRNAPDALQGQPEPSHGWCEPELADPRSQGPYTVGDYINFVANDYLFPVDPAWAAEHTPGKRLATGRLRDGGQGGRGPSLIVYAPGDAGSPPSAGASLPAQALLLYSTITAEDDLTMDGYSHADEWSGGAWMTRANQDAVVFVGTKGLGRTWYGYGEGTVWPENPPYPPEPEGERGWWGEEFMARILFYDPRDLAAVARGEMAPHEPQPYAWLDVEDRLFGPHEAWHHLGACAFDRERGLLYVLEPLVDEDRPLVHVWHVG